MPRPRLLLVEDHRSTREALSALLTETGFDVAGLASAESAIEHLALHRVDVVLTDLQLPGQDGLALLRHARTSWPEIEVLVFTAYATIETAVTAIKQGAFDFITKPVHPTELELKLRSALERQRLRAEVRRLHEENAWLRGEALEGSPEIVGSSRTMQEVLASAALVANSDSTVLLRGESGTGKELIARAIHRRSARASRPFIRVNVAALAEGILESELFGHERGAFTGAVQRKPGKFELAADGTLFLDEIGDISLSAQTRLLRILQEREFERVGGHEVLRVDCRVIAATNQPLEQRISEGRFRQDLFYRLNVVPIHIPPLRQRKEDLPALVHALLTRYNQRLGRNVSPPGTEGLERLMAYDWPGNIRELENLIERGVVLGSVDRQLEGLTPASPFPGGLPGRPYSFGGPLGLADYLAKIERELIEEAYLRSSGNKSRAAQLLGMDRNLLRYKLQKYHIDDSGERGG